MAKTFAKIEPKPLKISIEKFKKEESRSRSKEGMSKKAVSDMINQRIKEALGSFREEYKREPA